MRPSTASTILAIATALSACSACSACNDSEDDAPSSRQAKPAQEGPRNEPLDAPSPRGQSPHPLLAWLDPEAVAVGYSEFPPAFDVEAFATVFAMPPRAGKLLREARDVIAGLEAVRDRESPPATSLFREPALVFLPQIARRPYVVRGLARPRAELDAFLTAAGFRRDNAQGYDIYQPGGVYPWKVVVLDDRTVAFVSAREIGVGLGPLTAGRDLGPTPEQQQLGKLLADDAELVAVVSAQGPLLHFDLAQALASWQLSARTWKRHGLDVELAMLPTSDVEAVAEQLEGRSADLANEQIRALVRRVAYQLDGNAVRGRLQLTPEDMAALTR